MADDDWLKFDNVNGVNTNANKVLNPVDPTHQSNQNQEVQLNYGYEFNQNSGENVPSPVESKKGCLTRRRLFVGLIGVILTIGAAIGISLTVPSPSSSNGTAESPLKGGKNKLDNNSIGGSHIPAPTPASMQYGGRPTESPGPTSSKAYLVADIIDSIARDTGNDIVEENSYQSRAKNWVLTQDLPIEDGSTMTMEQQATQLYALACIYYSTYSVKSDWTDAHFGPDVAVPGWYSSRGWLESAKDVCSNWHGLSCNDEGRVSKIQLDTNGLTGSFPPETAFLHETLTTIDLYNNMLHNSGDEGNTFLGELTNLEYLYLGSTFFQYDGIPSVIGKLTALKELDVSESLYFGSLDGATFSNLSNLRYLVIDGNMYNSSLPSDIAQLPNLEYLYAGFCSLQGGFEFLTSMQKIIELWVDDNPSLKGTIPSGIGNLSNLASFSASNCGLTGTIPTEIGTTNMIQMWLNDNYLTGEIPSEIANLMTLKILDVQHNDLRGQMPSEICNRRRPFGRLEELGADCDGEIACAEECCTCCGDQCTGR